MTSLYQVAEEYCEALRFIEDIEDIDDQTIQDTMESFQFELKDKVINVAAYIKNLEGALSIIKNNEKELKKRRSSLTKRAYKLKNYIKNNMIKCKLMKVESPLFDVRVSENITRVEILDARLISDVFVNIKETKSFDKAAIKAAIKSGKRVDGACLIFDKRLTIK